MRKKHEHPSRDWPILPENKAVTNVEQKNDVEKLVNDLTAVGVAKEQIVVHHGDAAKAIIDPAGEHHGLVFALLRKYQRLSGPEARLLEQTELAFNAGYFIVGVQTDGSEAEQAKIREIMVPRTDHTVYFCEQFSIKVLAL